MFCKLDYLVIRSRERRVVKGLDRNTHKLKGPNRLLMEIFFGYSNEESC